MVWQLMEDCRVFVVAVTRNRDDVNSALTISTRISIELEMTVPNAAQRYAVSVLLFAALLLFRWQLGFVAKSLGTSTKLLYVELG